MPSIVSLGKMEVAEDSDLAGVDLNLLIVLSSLLKHKNITRAGDELNLSQPATSRALKRLRAMFDDEILLRNNRNFVLSPLAELLEPKIHAALGNIEKIFGNIILAPKKFSIAMPDHIAMQLVSTVTAFIREASPATTFLPTARLDNTLEAMEEGTVDLAVGIAEDTPPGFFCRTLPPINTVCLVRKNHPITQSRIAFSELGRFLSIRVGASFNTGFGELFDGLEALRPRGKETVTAPDAYTAARLVLDTDAVLILPASSAGFLAKRFGLATCLPTKGPALPDYQVSLIWHERWHRDPLHSGIRSMLASRIISGPALSNAENSAK